MKRVCVFCGSSPGGRPEYAEAARELAAALVSEGLELVYGGARVGLMGELARAVLALGGRVTGVMPRGLAERELAFTEVSDLRIVGSMHERKALMADLSDAFVALPGGLGTIEELFEVLTWAQLGLHAKPCGLLNVCGYYDRLAGFLDHAVAERFVHRPHREVLLVSASAADLLSRFRSWRPPSIDKARWVLSEGERSRGDGPDRR